MKPLLAIDGDSFAHRAFHALPRSFRRDDGGPANTLIGFMSMLLRLWQAERPRAVVVGWDTLVRPDLPQRAARRPTSRAASSTPRSSTSSSCCRRSSRRRGSSAASRRASRPTTSSRPPSPASGRAAAPRSSRPPTATRSSSPPPTSRSCSRCAASASSRGSARPRCASATASSPHQVRDFIALRGDPSDKIPGARGVGEKTAASLLQTLPRSRGDDRRRAVRGRGRAAPHLPADRDARPDGAACPTLPDLEPDWAAGAGAAEELGVERLAARLREA